jgi:transposase
MLSGVSTNSGDCLARVGYYQYRADRARRSLRGIDQQIGKAEKAVAGQIPVKRNRFVQLTGGTKSVNRHLEAKARALAGLKGYVTNLEAPTPEFVMAAYYQLWQIEKNFRMSKSDLRARPIYHHKRDSIEAHLTIVFAALAVTQWLERQTGWSIKKLITACAATTPSTSKPETRSSPPKTPARRHPSRPRPAPPPSATALTRCFHGGEM